MALLTFWITWPPNFKLRVAQAGYKAPMRRRPMKRGQDNRTDMERMIEAQSGIVKFKDLPDYIKQPLLELGKNARNDPTSRDRS